MLLSLTLSLFLVVFLVVVLVVVSSVSVSFGVVGVVGVVAVVVVVVVVFVQTRGSALPRGLLKLKVTRARRCTAAFHGSWRRRLAQSRHRWSLHC